MVDVVAFALSASNFKPHTITSRYNSEVKKLTVFICIPWFHPAFRAGGPVQSIANMVNELAGIDFRIYCSNTDLNNTTLENIEINKWVHYNDHTMVWYAGPDKRSDSVLKQLAFIKPDILYIVGIFSWHFNMVPLIFSKVSQKIISVRGMLHPGALSQKSGKKKIFLSLWKLFNLHKKTSFHATDFAEEKHIHEVFGEKVSTTVAGNFPRKFLPQTTINKDKGSLRLVSIALISPMKNHLLVLQALEKCTGMIEYHICGPVKDMQYWQECLLQIKNLPVNITVQYHGDVQPQMVEGYLHDCDVFILPSKSENFGHAIYEALTAGKPVITSNHTPWRELKKNRAGLNADTDIAAIKDAIEFFTTMDAPEYNVWKMRAAQYATDAFDLDETKEQYRRLFRKQ